MGAESYIYMKKASSNLTARVTGSTKLVSAQKAKFAIVTEKIHIFDKVSEFAIK